MFERIKTDYLENDDKTTNNCAKQNGVKRCTTRVRLMNVKTIFLAFPQRKTSSIPLFSFFLCLCHSPLLTCIFHSDSIFFISFHFMCRFLPWLQQHSVYRFVSRISSVFISSVHILFSLSLLFARFVSLRCVADLLLVLTIFLWLISILNKSSFYSRSFEHLYCSF